MIPDFSPKMLRGFLNARIEMAGYRAEFPDERKSVRRKAMTFDEARVAERSAIMKRARVTAEQFELALAGRIVSLDARARLWKALNADPASHGIRLLGGSGQERMI
ncbi:hypothetical protein [Neorhizobium sp. NCHU2750]|uniref:hypothetical protein n=1 Tax=Neorhizobium sp. NCHU2750 TaxID=1825976 RepID=UPI000E70E027|nr:hypothetical protein NCHU2750_06110 [Neorhizobium sp. NCHU2750]